MAEYGVYHLGPDGRIVRMSPLLCSDDAEAIEQAWQIAGDQAAEIWSGDRLVKRLAAR